MRLVVTKKDRYIYSVLFDENNHLTFLDDFAANYDLREAYLEKYQTVEKLRRILPLSGKTK